jgi:hypothetical protein
LEGEPGTSWDPSLGPKFPEQPHSRSLSGTISKHNILKGLGEFSKAIKVIVFFIFIISPCPSII